MATNSSVNNLGYITQGAAFSNVDIQGKVSASNGEGLTIDAPLYRSPNRYYLEEFFLQKPGVVGDISNAAEAVRMIANSQFEVSGVNAVTADSTFSTTLGGVQIATAGADNDQIIIRPHDGANQSAWLSVLWGTENQIEWECALTTSATITTQLIGAGLALEANFASAGNAGSFTIATAADQAWFRYSTDDSNTTWQVVYSIGGTDTTVSTNIDVLASTTYRFRISVDSSRIARFYINEGLVATSTALTNDVDLMPFVGTQALAVAVRNIVVHYIKMSRILFE